MSVALGVTRHYLRHVLLPRSQLRVPPTLKAKGITGRLGVMGSQKVYLLQELKKRGIRVNWNPRGGFVEDLGYSLKDE